jgi:hypothetical protein
MLELLPCLLEVQRVHLVIQSTPRNKEPSQNEKINIFLAEALQ